MTIINYHILRFLETLEAIYIDSRKSVIVYKRSNTGPHSMSNCTVGSFLFHNFLCLNGLELSVSVWIMCWLHDMMITS